MNDKELLIKELIVKDFNEILVNEFCTDWKEKRLYIELLVRATHFDYLLNYIQEKDKEIERLKEELEYTIPIVEHNKTITKHLKEIGRLKNIIKEVREILKYHLSNPSGTKNGWHIDIWNSEDINK